MTQTTLYAALRLEGIRPGWGWLWLMLVVAGAVFLYWTYRGIFRRSERRLTWALMALRGVGLILLVLMLAKPTWTRERDDTDRGRVAVVVDNSRSMALPDADGMPRYSRAVEAAGRLQKAWAEDRNGPRLNVEFFDITGNRFGENKLPAEPTADATDLTRALRQTMTRLRSKPLAAVVLISDGVDNSGRPNFLDWEETSVPIHTVGFPRSVTLDLAVREPQVPRRVLVHNELRVEVPVAKVGGPATEATVTLRRGRDELATKKVKLPAGDGEQLVALTFKPDQPGTFEITAEVKGLAGEKDLSNNAVNFPLHVVADPIRVLYVEGFLRYEYKYLKERLEDDPDVGLVTVVRRLRPGEPGAAAGKVALNEKQLEKFDVVILGDMESTYITGPEYRQLVRWLDGKNRSLLVLGGYHSFGPRGFRATPLADVLPVVFAPGDEPQSEKPFKLKPTDKGEAHPIFTVSSDRARNVTLWADAPPLDGMNLVARAKPGADVLAVNPQLEVDGKPAVALAVQRAGGGGQVMVLCADTTWSWSRLPRLIGQPDNLYGRFWSQTVRWLAGRSPDDKRPLLSVRLEKPVFEAERKVMIWAVRQPRPGVDLSGALTTVEVTDPKGNAVPGLTPRVSSADPDAATFEFYPTLSGEYKVAAALKSGGKMLGNQNVEFRVRGKDLEMADTGTRPDHLRAIASATGGMYVDVDDADALKDKVQRIERRQTRTLRSQYWDSPWLFSAFLLAVTGEWFLRRRNHLV
jgi:uncharacterized membrane protein